MSSMMSGVFPFLTGYAAFVDTVSIAIVGRMRSRVKSHTKVIANKAIGGSGRIYARVLEAVCCLSGNPFSVSYGKLKPYAAIAPYRVTIRSENSPMTLSGVQALLGSLFWKHCHAKITYVELAFDTHLDLGFLRKHAFTKALVGKRIHDQNGRQTFYIGRPAASWQICCYDKKPGTTRFEYALRPAFLRRHGIDTLDDIGLLRRLRFQDLAALKELRDEGWKHALSRLSRQERNDLLHLTSRCRIQRLLRQFSKYSTASTTHLARYCREDLLLRRMQKRLIW